MKGFCSIKRLGFYVVLLAVLVVVGFAGSNHAYAYYPIVSATTSTLPDLPLGPYVVCRDGGASLRVTNQNVFTFGDTALSATNPDGVAWCSTSYITNDTDADNGISGGYNYRSPYEVPRQWILLTSAEVAYNNQPGPAVVALWPSSGFKNPNTGKQYIWFAKELEHPDTGVVEHKGMGFAEVTSPTLLTRLRHRPGQTEDYIMFTPTEGDFGNIACVSGGYAYAFFTKYNVLGGEMRVARASLTDGPDSGSTLDFLQRNNWRFWNGSSWVTSYSSASVILTGIAAGSIEWNPYLNGWLYTHLDWISEKIVMNVANNPWGPWSTAKYITSGRVNPEGNPYFCVAHKILEKNNGQTQYVTYSTRGGTGGVGTGEGVCMVKVNLQK